MGALAVAAAGAASRRAAAIRRAPATACSSGRSLLARRGAARPDLVYSLLALAPVLAATGDAEARARRAARGPPALSPLPRPRASSRAPGRRRRAPPARPGGAARRWRRVDDLSEREMAVLRLLPTSCRSREIAGDALRLEEHREDACAAHLPQARRRHPRRGVTRARALRLL